MGCQEAYLLFSDTRHRRFFFFGDQPGPGVHHSKDGPANAQVWSSDAVGGGVGALVLHSGRPVLLEDCGLDNRFDPSREPWASAGRADRPPLAALLALPVLPAAPGGGKPLSMHDAVGVLLLANKRKGFVAADEQAARAHAQKVPQRGYAQAFSAAHGSSITVACVLLYVIVCLCLCMCLQMAGVLEESFFGLLESEVMQEWLAAAHK